MARYDLSDAEWALIKEFFPNNSARRGRPWSEHRTILNGMFWILRSGAPWRDLPGRYGKWQTIYDRFARYQKDGTLERILKRLQLKLDAQGRIDWEICSIDGTNIRAAKAAGGASKKSATVNFKITH